MVPLTLWLACVFFAQAAPAMVDMGSVIRQTNAILGDRNWFSKLQQVTIPDTSAYPSSKYRVVPFALEASLPHKDKSLISVATQCSVDFAHEVLQMARHWRARISLAVFALKGVGVTHQLLARLRQCSYDMESYVDFHIVFVDGPQIYEDYRAGNVTDGGYIALVNKQRNVFRHVSCDEILRKGFSSVFQVW